MSDTTPQNWPIHNVRLTDEEISDIVRKVFIGGEATTKTNLGKKKSFNNRIYFIDIAHQSQEEEDTPEKVVLKVNGRFFGSSKIQNEVSCLLLLQHFCPDVPAPRIVAWSEDGSKICAIRNGVFAVLYDEVIESDDISQPSSIPGWIMTTKLPGRILQRNELLSKNENLAKDLAKIVASWRTNIPHRPDIGNLAFQPAGYTSSNALHGLEITNGGLILCDTQPSSIIDSTTTFYTHLLSDQMHKLETNKVFSYARSRLLAMLESFRESGVPQLLSSSETAQDNKSVFTQQDFAPRNVLVEESDDGSLHVSGIVDFEFAGLYPPAEEFLTCRARQSEDWPQEFFEALCSELALQGLDVPGYNAEKAHFDILCDLAVLTENVAPWWLQDGHVTGQELEDQLDRTCRVAEGIVEKLSNK